MSYILDEQDLKILFHSMAAWWHGGEHCCLTAWMSSANFPVSDLDPIHWWRSGSGLGHCMVASHCSLREDGSNRENFTVYRNIPYMWPMKCLTLLTLYTTVNQIKAFLIGQEGIPRVMLWSITALRLSPSCITPPHSWLIHTKSQSVTLSCVVRWVHIGVKSPRAMIFGSRSRASCRIRPVITFSTTAWPQVMLPNYTMSQLDWFWGF